MHVWKRHTFSHKDVDTSATLDIVDESLAFAVAERDFEPKLEGLAYCRTIVQQQLDKRDKEVIKVF